MYSIRIRDHILIAHSLNRPVFGPAQNMHGATYVVDVTFSSPNLDENNIVIDIGYAHQALKDVLNPLNYQNLDNHPELKNELTTTEFLAKYIHDQLKAHVKHTFSGKIAVTLGESHVAWANYTGE
ncbi:MAG: 6-carboxytetrahydropterin synthase [Bacteroidetes bacterium]|jgi:6-pyruvoyl-tetrahydropterin synthase|nr:6-carboxytetrahydropterin synthase [Bacteroidota bacterium]